MMYELYGIVTIPYKVILLAKGLAIKFMETNN